MKKQFIYKPDVDEPLDDNIGVMMAHKVLEQEEELQNAIILEFLQTINEKRGNDISQLRKLITKKESIINELYDKTSH